MNKKGKVKKKRRRLKVKVLLKFLIVLVLIALISVYFYNLKIKNIYIVGNDTVKDIEIIEAAGIKDYPPIFRLNKKKMKNNISNIPLIALTPASIAAFSCSSHILVATFLYGFSAKR